MTGISHGLVIGNAHNRVCLVEQANTAGNCFLMGYPKLQPKFSRKINHIIKYVNVSRNLEKTYLDHPDNVKLQMPHRKKAKKACHSQ